MIGTKIRDKNECPTGIQALVTILLWVDFVHFVNSNTKTTRMILPA